MLVTAEGTPQVAFSREPRTDDRLVVLRTDPSRATSPT